MSQFISEAEGSLGYPWQHTQQLALRFFDAAVDCYRLSARARWLLQVAHAFSVAGRLLARERPDRVGRDLVLAARLPDLTAEEQAVVACVVAFQREKVRRMREAAFVRLSSADRVLALRLAAFIQLADEVREVQVCEVQVERGGTMVRIVGLQAHEQAAGVHGRLWRVALGDLVVCPVASEDADASGVCGTGGVMEGGETLLPPFTMLRLADDGAEPVAEFSRRVLRQFFEKLLACEEAVLAGEDAEDVHEMRVITRRLRASLQVVAPVYKRAVVRDARRRLRRLAEVLGAVRDRDVFLEHVLAYCAQVSDGERVALEPLIAAVRAEHEQARARLLKALGRRWYREFKYMFATFLTTPGAAVMAGGDVPLRVRDFAGGVLWQRYEAWRAYEVVISSGSDALVHQARIAGKRLRYTLEFFARALGARVEEVLTPLAALQECLGALQDEVAADAQMRATRVAGGSALEGYRQSRAAAHAEQVAALPARWARVASRTYQRRLFELIIRL